MKTFRVGVIQKIARAIPMKRELKEVIPSLCKIRLKCYRKGHPDEKGTESDHAPSQRLTSTNIARAIPMKRELKDTLVKGGHGQRLSIARAIPMKRELKVIVEMASSEFPFRSQGPSR